MFKDITIGQYFPADTAVHRLDPRFKITLMFFFIISLFFINSFSPYILIVLWLILVIKKSEIPMDMMIRGIKPLKWIIIITVIMNIFFIPGEVIFEYSFISITKEGVRQAIFMAIRLVLLVLGTSLLTLTTSPIELTEGIEKLLSPLKKIGFPAHAIAMMMTIALRFIPTLIEEADKIMKAQMARGADFESGNLLSRAKNLVPLMVPLFINALRRADDLANAMEARCYRGEGNRTRLNELVITNTDRKIFIINTIFFVLVCATRFIPLP
ncbi:energy-coupling factor transporter transmembrane protein EcfT [Peptoniphilus sp. KCTC 25270]|uniref:energy-coupling factor transporter transmembrane component T family protein n=1 Tax=Peptoniphilus sp. KCTC 25270 TaxID=2897414 RepID=UPI001E4D5BA0|nr:energy-coupling factor transporter transmembrane component T [Peptoniphilus sp. KCTC 25270]MCD1146740.1 energy-coupling factor transporter transmembrane protein EcfT [Peptoniphilus sp. KCTC 25270]